MAQQQTTQQQQAQAQDDKLVLKELGVAEVIAMAISIRRKLVAKGKTTRRVGFYLRPHLIPPSSGVYESAMGKVRIFSTFSQERGAWFVQVKLPDPEEGFEVADLVKNPPSPSQATQS